MTSEERRPLRGHKVAAFLGALAGAALILGIFAWPRVSGAFDALSTYVAYSFGRTITVAAGAGINDGTDTGTAAKVLHGGTDDVAWGAVVAGDLALASDNVFVGNASGVAEAKALTDCVFGAVTYDAAVNTWGCNVLVLASADFANQGTTTTVLHGNAAGNPSWVAVSLTTEVSGILPSDNGGTGTATETADSVLVGTGSAWTARVIPDADNIGQALRYDNATDAFSAGTFVNDGSAQSAIDGAKTWLDAQTIGTTADDATLTVNRFTAGSIQISQTHQHTDSDTVGAVGLGVGELYRLENASSALDDAAQIHAIWTDALGTSEDADLVFQVSQADVLTEIARFDAIEDELEVSGGLETTGGVGVGNDPPTAGLIIGAGGATITNHQSGTASLDFDLSPAGVTCQAFTIAVSDAALGDTVACGIPNSVLGTDWVCSCWVSAAGNAAVRCCDVQSQNLNPSAATFRADVWRH